MFLSAKIIRVKKYSFDEHKIILCSNNEKRALQIYKNSYSDNASQRIGSIVGMDINEFKKWIKTGNHNIQVK
jgi:hypothetical protein